MKNFVISFSVSFWCAAAEQSSRGQVSCWQDKTRISQEGSSVLIARLPSNYSVLITHHSAAVLPNTRQPNLPTWGMRSCAKSIFHLKLNIWSVKQSWKVEWGMVRCTAHTRREVRVVAGPELEEDPDQDVMRLSHISAHRLPQLRCSSIIGLFWLRCGQWHFRTSCRWHCAARH